MNRDRLWLSLAFLLPALAATIATLSTFDLAFGVRAGALMLERREILGTDPFTFTAAGKPWLNQQWGSAVLLALGHGLGGWGGLAVLRVILVAIAVGMVAIAARRGLSWRGAALLALAGFVIAIGSIGLRAQLFGIVLFAAVTAILAWRERFPRATWAVPFLVLLWANVHGSFFLGPAAVAAALLEDVVERRPATRRLAIVLAASLAVTVLTPFGPGVWAYAMDVATNPEIARRVSEWQRISPLTVTGVLFFGSVVAAIVMIVVAWRWEASPRWPTVVWLAGLALLGAWAERGVAWWAIGAPAALAPCIGAWLAARRGEVQGGGAATTARPEGRRSRLLGAAVAALLLLAIVVTQPFLRATDPLTGPAGLLGDAPAGIARALAQVAGPADRAVVPLRWASWLEWAAPGVPVMVDSRVEVVPASAWVDYDRVAAGGPEALATLAGIGATVVVVDATTGHAELEIALRTPDGGWRVVYEDDDGLVFARSR